MDKIQKKFFFSKKKPDLNENLDRRFLGGGLDLNPNLNFFENFFAEDLYIENSI